MVFQCRWTVKSKKNVQQVCNLDYTAFIAVIMNMVSGRLLASCPVPYSLYCKCVEVEELGVASGEGNMGKLREVYERALRDYGISHVGKCIRNEYSGTFDKGPLKEYKLPEHVYIQVYTGRVSWPRSRWHCLQLSLRTFGLQSV